MAILPWGQVDQDGEFVLPALVVEVAHRIQAFSPRRYSGSVQIEEQPSDEKPVITMRRHRPARRW